MFAIKVCLIRKGVCTMMNMNNKKTQRKISAVIAILLVIAMIVPLAMGILGY